MLGIKKAKYRTKIAAEEKNMFLLPIDVYLIGILPFNSLN
ncbi:hypothetical protein EDO6_02069 [Paenibacillus xylanexedens]|nr:hypothetical protein EDO6_02069 [Paenibacillus xylanexedens]